MKIQRGELYYADLSPTVGSEQFGMRPVLILQNDIGNKFSPTTLIAPLTTKHKTRMPTHIDLELQSLPAKSVVMLEQIRCIDRRRLHEYIGKLDKPLMKAIDNAILISFGIKRYEQNNSAKIKSEKRKKVTDMFFADESLRGYEYNMKVIPNFGKRGVWEGKEFCNDCKKYDHSFKACVDSNCPYIVRKMEAYSVTTKHLMQTLLSRITYVPFNNRLYEVLNHFYGNKLYLSTTHLVLFRNALIKSKIKKEDYGRIAAMYVLTMVPDTWAEMVLGIKGFICQRSTHDRKEKMIMKYANQLFAGNGRPDLSAISNESLFSDAEFICLCNALMISRYGTSVIKLRMTDRQESVGCRIIK